MVEEEEEAAGAHKTAFQVNPTFTWSEAVLWLEPGGFAFPLSMYRPGGFAFPLIYVCTYYISICICMYIDVFSRSSVSMRLSVSLDDMYLHAYTYMYILHIRVHMEKDSSSE